MSTTVTMPQLGESVVEGTIGKWLVKEGDRVERDQPVVEVLTDKADSEVPSPVAGIVSKLLAKEDEVVRVGLGLFIVEEGAGTANVKPEPKGKPAKASNEIPPPPVEAAAEAKAKPAEPKPAEAKPAAPPPVAAAPAAPNGGTGQPAVIATGAGSPSQRKAAREQGVDLSVSARPATLAPVAVAPAAVAPAPASGKKSAFQVPPYIARKGDQVIPFSRRRRIIADHMVYSKLTSPHVVAVAECDIFETAKLRDAHKDKLKKEGISLTYLAFVCAATVKALREFKELNARVLDDAYVLLAEVDVAVDTPDGLVVPVIKNADNLTVRGVARAIDDIATKARDGKLTPDDLAGKTFTVSNPGRRGNLHGGAIISQPSVGILRIGEIKKRVVVVERDGQDTMAIHPVMYLSLSYDHRIVDGVNANGFLFRVSEILEKGEFEI